jgi:hypothetical protein
MRGLSVLLTAALASPVAAATVPADLAGLLPPDVQVVVAVDAAALRSNPTVQRWLLEQQAPWSGVPADAAAFLRDAGVDPVQDIDALVLGFAPSEGREQVLALVGGRFDPASLGAALLARGATAVPLGPATAYQPPERPTQGARPATLILPLATTILAGTEEAVAAAAHRQPAPIPLLTAAVAAGRVDLSAHFWVVADVPERPQSAAELTQAAEGAREMGEVLLASRTVRRATMQATLDEALHLKGLAEADTAENAELLRDAIKGALAAMRLEAQERAPELVDVLRDVRVGLDGTVVSVVGAVPIALIERHASACQPRPNTAP